jgi:hypothetical protein
LAARKSEWRLGGKKIRVASWRQENPSGVVAAKV